MYKRILVPLDGSRLAEQALPHAAIHAEKFGAVTVLLIALGSLPEPSMAGRRIVRSAEEASAQVAQTYLEDIAASLREREPLNWAWLDAMAYEGTPLETPEPADAEQKSGFFVAHLPRIGPEATLTGDWGRGQLPPQSGSQVLQLAESGNIACCCSKQREGSPDLCRSRAAHF